MEKPVLTLDFEIDESFVSRLVLGALSEHEQRMLAAALARSDPGFRRSLRSVLEPFETFDGDLTAEYAAVLDREAADVDRARREILSRSFARAPDIETLIEDLTVSDALSLGGAPARALPPIRRRSSRQDQLIPRPDGHRHGRAPRGREPRSAFRPRVRRRAAADPAGVTVF